MQVTWMTSAIWNMAAKVSNRTVTACTSASLEYSAAIGPENTYRALAKIRAMAEARISELREISQAVSGARAPIRKLTRRVSAIPILSGSMNNSDTTFRAIWCPATTTGPSGARNNAITENMLASTKMVKPIGTPMRRM